MSNIRVKRLQYWVKSSLILCLLISESCNYKKKSNSKLLPIDKTNNHSSVTIQKEITKTEATGYFDNDNIVDTLFYYLDTSKGEPLINCEMVFGNMNRSKNFLVSTGSGYVDFYNCQRGCLEKEEITTGIYASNIIETFFYNDKEHNWIIVRTSFKSDSIQSEETEFKTKWTIDGQILH